MDLKHSDVGPFSVAILNVAVNYYISHILLPQVNGILQKGYPPATTGPYSAHKCCHRST
ncbi:unnamed protein product [Staurois parvus]|uniref:Lipid-binding serum glycoprotein C-terminal domain-containing protein n=1 Tax=Staurois parvus TaxID=386267 RepID=A0ABN9GEE8_9NEOB|nr:unnamed protein product [Staurois parvus]